MSNPMPHVHTTTATWTKSENKKFEIALDKYGADTPDRWSKVAACVQGKSVHDVVKKYEELIAEMRRLLPTLQVPHEYRNNRKRPSLQLPISDVPECSTQQPAKKKTRTTKKNKQAAAVNGIAEADKGKLMNICHDHIKHKTTGAAGSCSREKYLANLQKSLAKFGYEVNRKAVHVRDVAISPAAEALPGTLDSFCRAAYSCPQPDANSIPKAAYFSAPQTALLNTRQPPTRAAVSVHPNPVSYQAADFTSPQTALLNTRQPPTWATVPVHPRSVSYQAADFTSPQTALLNTQQQPPTWAAVSVHPNPVSYQAADFTPPQTALLDTQQQPPIFANLPSADPVSVIERKTEDQAKSVPACVINMHDIDNTADMDTGKGRDEPQMNILDDPARTGMDSSTQLEPAQTDDLTDFTSLLDAELDEEEEDDDNNGLPIPTDNLDDIDFSFN